MLYFCSVSGVLLIGAGAILDTLTVVWAYGNACGHEYRSGNFVIPAFFYVSGGLLYFQAFSVTSVSFCALLVAIHLFCYLILPIVLDYVMGARR